MPLSFRRKGRTAPTAPAQDQRRERVDALGFWFHSVDLGGGLITPGVMPNATLNQIFDEMSLPDLKGKTVLDIGAWDGFYSFEAERRGAARVLSLDHYMWSVDLAKPVDLANPAPAPDSVAAEVVSQPQQYHETELWDPVNLPGKRGYDTAHEMLGSKVEWHAEDFMEMDLAPLGTLDVVFYLGVLYHMEDPLRALRRVRQVTGELAVVETEATVFPGYEDKPIFHFWPGIELNKDPSNWWSPNLAGLVGMLHAAGFSQVDVLRGPDPAMVEAPGGPHQYRALVQARP
jgi:tRNA (mo5U34)-methyltransferase